MGIRKYIVTLTSEESERLIHLVSSGQDKAYRIKHANILLAADALGPQLPSREIARMFSCYLNTVSDLCQRFVEQGLEAAHPAKARWARGSTAHRPGVWSAAGRVLALGVAAAGRCVGGIGRGGEHLP